MSVVGPSAPGAFLSARTPFGDSDEAPVSSRDRPGRDGHQTVASAVRASTRPPSLDAASGPGVSSARVSGPRAGALGSYARHTRAGLLATAPSMPSLIADPSLSSLRPGDGLSSPSARLNASSSAMLSPGRSALSLTLTPGSEALSFAATTQAPLPLETGTRAPPGSALLVAFPAQSKHEAFFAATTGAIAAASAAAAAAEGRRSQWDPSVLGAMPLGPAGVPASVSRLFQAAAAPFFAPPQLIPPSSSAHSLPVFLPSAPAPPPPAGATPAPAAATALPRPVQRALASRAPPSSSAADAEVLTRVRAALGLSEDQQFAPPGPHMQPQSPPQARGPLATAGWAAATAASGSAAGGALSPAFSATAPVSQQQQQQQQQRRAAAAAAAAGAPALVFSPADPSNSSHNNSSSRGGSIAVATVAASSASADPSAAAAGAAGAVLVDSLAQRLRSGTYRSVLDENARLAEAVRQADAVSGELIANAAALTELAAQHDAEAQRLMAALDASGAEREHVEVEVRGLRRLMGRMRAERAQALHHLTTACGKLGVATDRVLTLESRNERVEFELAEIKRALRDEAERAAQHRDEASALRAERKKRHAELEQLQKDRAELTQLRLRSDALRLEWERKERAWTEERDALMAQLAARRQRQLASDAELRQVREEKGTLATDLARAAQLASELDLKVDSLRRDLRSEREGVSDRDKAIARLEKLLAEVRAQLKEEEESRARTAESAKDGGARLSAVEAELALLKQQLRTETEERRAAQQAHRQLKRDHEKAVKSSSKQGEEYLALLRQYEALKDRHINVNKELSAANAKVRSLEAQADASAELQLAFTQAQSDVQRLTLRLHDLKTSTDAQIMSLTDARDRLGHQSELLRSKVGAVSNAMEEQKAELKRLRRVEQDLEGIMQAVTVERDSAKREAEAVRSQLSEASDHNQGLVEALESTVAELRAELRRARHGSLRPPGSGQSPSGGDDEGGGGGGERRGSTSGGGGDGGSPSAAGGDSRGSVRLSRGTLVSRRFAAAQAAAAAGGTDPGEAAAAAAAAARRASAELRVSQSRADSAAAAAMLQDLLSQSQSEVQTLRSMLTTLEDEKTIRVQEMQDSRAQAADTQQRLTGSVIALQRKVAELEHELSKEREGRLGNDIY